MKAEPSQQKSAAKRGQGTAARPRQPAILRCYPRAWRERYGDELAELLARERRSPRLALDLVLGALDAHLHPQVGEPRLLRARRAIGVAILVAVLVAASYLGQHPTTARTFGALMALRPPAVVVTTATPAEHGLSQQGIRQE